MKKVFYNGVIITMDGTKTYEAFAIENGFITEVGDNADLLHNADVECNNLEGKTVLPAFIDAHSHLSSYANSFLQAQLKDATSFDDIICTLKKFSQNTNIQPGGWIIGNGYDHNILREHTHPTRQLLDEKFPEMSVVIQHKSGHFGVFNLNAIKKLGLEGKDRDGYLEENEYVSAIKDVPMPNPKQMLTAYQRAMDCYASYGITTVQEGMMVSQMLPLYKMLMQTGTLILDVVGYPQITDGDIFYQTFPQCSADYYSNFRLGGYKIILDGSPQGRTSWMKTPYLNSSDYYGISSMSDQEVSDAVKKCISEGRQLLAHCNGDAAAEQFLSAIERNATSHQSEKIRPVIIHGQLLAKNQLPRVKKLGIIPSFFVAHCYYWGDTHIENFGYKRASQISPTASSLKNSILFTFHQDTPVIEPNMLETIQCAVTRKTRSGVTIGPNEQISVYEALKAVTINVAYQYKEEKMKGSITPGKKANFIILNENPFKIPPERIRDISIVETYKDGNCIFKK